MERLSNKDNAYRYRYTRLRFLVRSGSKYFLLPDGWSAANPVTAILPDTEAIRIELAPGGDIAP